MARIPNNKFEEKLVMTFDHASTAATLTTKLWKVPVGKSFVVDRISYINPTGLAGASGNAFKGEVKDGATVVGTVFNTDTGASGATLAADTFVEATLSGTAAARWLVASDVLSIVFTKTGTATLPAGRLVIEGRLL